MACPARDTVHGMTGALFTRGAQSLPSFSPSNAVLFHHMDVCDIVRCCWNTCLLWLIECSSVHRICPGLQGYALKTNMQAESITYSVIPLSLLNSVATDDDPDNLPESGHMLGVFQHVLFFVCFSWVDISCHKKMVWNKDGPTIKIYHRSTNFYQGDRFRPKTRLYRRRLLNL